MSSVSVVIPVYNRALTISRALDSVFAQSHRVDEVIVVDDGSQDDLVGILNTQYPHVRCIQQGNHGVSHARNTGIRASSSDWIALLDSDDAWFPTKISKQLDALRSASSHKICHTDEIWIRNGVRVNQHKKHRKTGGRIYENCLPLCAISPSSVLIHRHVFDEVGYFDESLPACEDYDLWLRIAARYDVLLVREACVIKHGGHADQLSRQYWGMDRFRVQALHKMLDSPHLTDAEHAATRTCLSAKLKILLNGAQKRGRLLEAQRWRALLRTAENDSERYHA